MIFACYALGQTDTSTLDKKLLNVYIDCPTIYCDIEYFKQELPWVNYVRDRKLADLHIQINAQLSGNNAYEYLIVFTGLKDYEMNVFQMDYSTYPNQSQDETRKGLLQIIKLGLMPYMSSQPELFTISTNAEVANTELEVDKWKNWVFDISSNAWFNGQQSTNSISLWNSLSIKKVTNDWKYIFYFQNSYDESNFKYDGEIISSYQKSNSFQGVIVKSIGERFCLGTLGTYRNSTFSNYDASLSLYPGIEYNIFPYSESTQKMLSLHYRVGMINNNYRETTVFNKNEELLGHQKFLVVLKLVQNWGSIYTSLEASNYLHDFALYNLGIYTSMRIQLLKGLSFNINGGANLIRDQINLPAQGTTLEETLLNQYQLSTQFSYFGHVGFSYTFGSIYNNVINPRFGFN